MKATHRINEIYVGNIKSLPLYIDILLFPALAGLYLTGGMGIMLLILPSMFIHEAAHIITARLFSCRARALRLSFLGGILETDISSSGITAAQETVIFAFAPFVNIMLYSLFYAIGLKSNSLILLQLAFVNGAIASVNLLPLYPLDGGNILKTLLRIRLDERSTANVILIINSVFSVLLTLIFIIAAVIFKKYIWQLPAVSAFTLYSAIRLKKGIASNKVASILAKDTLLKNKRSVTSNTVYILKTTTLGEALKLAKDDSFNVFTVVDEDFNVLSEISEKELVFSAMAKGLSATVENVL